MGKRGKMETRLVSATGLWGFREANCLQGGLLRMILGNKEEVEKKSEQKGAGT